MTSLNVEIAHKFFRNGLDFLNRYQLTLGAFLTLFRILPRYTCQK
jgi:hypothetical protein